MTILGTDVLLVGKGFSDSEALTAQMREWGFRCHFASSVCTAHKVIRTVGVDLVLSNTCLPDGTGFRLVSELSRFPVTAFLCLFTDETCFWLPAIDGGKMCLGLPALWPAEFVRTLEGLARCAGPLRLVN
jgi:hypothetical protein